MYSQRFNALFTQPAPTYSWRLFEKNEFKMQWKFVLHYK